MQSSGIGELIKQQSEMLDVWKFTYDKQQWIICVLQHWTTQVVLDRMSNESRLSDEHLKNINHQDE
jgi:hypothetical protein